AAAIVRPVRDDSPNPLRSYAALLSRAPSVRRMFLVTVMNTIAYGILTTFLPLHAAANGLSTAEIGLIFTGGGVAFIVVQAVLRGFNAAADLGFFLGPVAGGILAGWGVKWAFAIAPVVTLLAVIWLADDR